MMSFARMPRVIFAVGVAALLGSLAVPAHAVTIDWVTVGDPGNTADTAPAGYGAVAAAFQIMKYEFTNQQYTDFLNSVAATDTYSLYAANMGSDARGGITQSGASGSYTYATKTNMGDKPVMYVSWFDAARVSNWLMNGATGTSSTETGAYTLSGATSGTAPAVNSGATFYIPTEDQWYKAAYYKGGSTNAGYWDYATQSDTAPTAVTAGLTGIGSAGNAGNFANFNSVADWNGQDGNVTTVGTNGGASAYGAFDMSGNLYEWNDLTGAAGSNQGLRGGTWLFSAADLSSSYRNTDDPSFGLNDNGFRLASVAVPEPSTCASLLAGLACGGWQMWRRRKRCNRASKAATSLALAAVFFCATNAHAQVTIDLVPVGNAGNANDPATGNLYGAVNYSYQIGKYDVTIGQYTDFLNAVAATDTYSLYNGSMATDLYVAGIAQTGSSGSYTYSAIAPSGTTPAGASSPGNRPITYVNWFDSARFANWMANGQPTGAQNSTTTENGAYALSGTTTAPAKNMTNPNTSAPPTFFIPTENEWYKAAYFDPTLNSNAGGYYTYATQSNTAPGNQIGSGSNQANYAPVNVYSVTQSGAHDFNQNYLTDVGAFSSSGSFYGTFDQNGNVIQWNDLDGTSGSSRGLRGGFWSDDASYLSSSDRSTDAPSGDGNGLGFRLAAPVAVPEPSTCAMALAGLACGGYSLFRRRKQA